MLRLVQRVGQYLSIAQRPAYEDGVRQQRLPTVGRPLSIVLRRVLQQDVFAELLSSQSHSVCKENACCSFTSATAAVNAAVRFAVVAWGFWRTM